MTIPTMIERTADGFRASTSTTPERTAVRPTAAEALLALNAVVAAESGGRDHVAGVPPPDGSDPYAPPIGDDPWFPEFLAACEENRRLAAESLDQAG